MSDSDTKLCAELAEWIEPKPAGCPEGGLCSSVPSQKGWWIWNGIEWRVKKRPDTDPVAALELLGWLASPPKLGKPNVWITVMPHVADNLTVVDCVSRYGGKETRISARSPGRPHVAVPKAIARVAWEVMKSEKERKAVIDDALCLEVERLQRIIDSAQAAIKDGAYVCASFLLSRAAHGARLTGEGRTKYEAAAESEVKDV